MVKPERLEDDEIAKAKVFLEEVFPNSLFFPATLPQQVQRRMDVAGLGLVQVISLEDGSENFATYVRKQTRHTAALERIWEAEQAEQLSPGSYDSAVDAIVAGEFFDEWGNFLLTTA